mmetsp:Transcript_21290/g.24289  ORF Transcript_21290/g.24289 Transcript_21290/m.24289 type:complete len:251 (-) Transcript_21290:84-836(-)
MNHHHYHLLSLSLSLLLLLLVCSLASCATGFLATTSVRHGGSGGRSCCQSLVNSDSDSEAVDSYDPSVLGGCVKNLENHIRLLDQSLEESSGTGVFRWIQQEQQHSGDDDDNADPTPRIAMATELDADTRFGILSHGTQADPIFNYGNRASLELFEQTIETLCRTPSRHSTVPELMEDRSQLIEAIERDGHGTIDDAIRVGATGNLFRIRRIVVWTVRDDAHNRIGLAAIYDREGVVPYDDKGQYKRSQL